MRSTDIPGIRSLPLFSEIGEDSFERLIRGAYVQNFPPHTELITEGESADFLHIVVSGTVELGSSWNERETCMALVEPHTTFILAATIRDRPYLMSARTISKARIIMIPSEDIRSVFENDSEFAKSIVEELAGCYRDAVKHAKNIKLRSSVERLANYLVRQASQSSEGDRISLDIEKKKLASFLGMTPENLSRAFTALRNHGVEVNGEQVRLNRPEDLTRFARPDPLIDG